MSGVVGTAVSNMMRYSVKQSAVRSENSLRNIKASNGTSFTQALGTDIIFEIPASANGTYIDFSKSFFRFTKTFTFNPGTTKNDLAYERGPESCLRRVQIFDAGGTLLENFEHYNECYALMELTTSCASDRKGLAKNYHEGYQWVNGTGQIENYPDLGGNILHCEANAMTNGVGKLLQVPSSTSINDTAQTFTVDVVFQLSSALFGGSSQKYIPSTALNGIRYVLTLDSVLNTYQNYHGVEKLPEVSITDPTFFYSVVKVDPMIDVGLLTSARGRDGLIRVHTQRWSMFAHTLNSSDNSFSDEYIIPIRVSSLKGVYFGFTTDKTTAKGTIADNNDLLQAHDKDSIGNMKTSWMHNGLSEYQFFMDGMPNPSTPVRVGRAQVGHQNYQKTGFGRGEHMTELCRALHINQKSADGTFLSLLNGSPDGESGHLSRNMLFGGEFESFASRSSVIESGTNTLNSNLSLRMTFTKGNSWDPANSGVPDATFADKYKNLRVYCLYDCFILMDPSTGSIRVEI
mmetsp:Transcript_5361/g.8810  ORF Transcript_5361/g.8810 Transcript_5361/m.8810 type:complete len:516 (+) Transcript_5361:2278-3825(+)